MTAAPIREFAPAKLNLALHVTGRQADGYHGLDSLVVFADAGDWVEARPGECLALDVDGPNCANVPVDGNLVLKAAAALADAVGRPRLAARLKLDKHLPAAAGLGGGSSDAAATLRALNRLWELGLDTSALVAIGARLGADVPVCIAARTARIRGRGDVVTPIAGLPRLHLVLANPGRPLATAAVFAALGRRDNPGLPDPPSRFDSVAALIEYLRACRNDLEAPAFAAEPVTAEVLSGMAGERHCLLARMSGSGATCFGVFASAEHALEAKRSLARRRPQWWLAAAQTL